MFLEKLSESILSKSKENLADICIVVPNNRAIVHMREQFKDKLKGADFLPEMISIQDFVLELKNIQKPTTLINNVDLLLELFNVCKSIDDQIDFRKFISWAPTVLKDFNEIDLYLANADDIFVYVSEAQAIKLWAPQYQVLSDYEKNYLKFLESLKEIYHKFKSYLSDKGLAYTGQAYRDVAENIENISKLIKWDKIIFAGFNALSKSEIKFFDYLYKNNQAEIVWDLDKYYFDNKHQEAGMFLREMSKLWPKTFPEIIEDNFSSNKEIHIINTNGNIQQAKVVGNILQKNNFNPNETAVVLADEALLLPVLNSIPEKYDKFNVTMGVPLDGNSISVLISDLFLLHSKSIVSGNIILFRSEILKKIILNPIFKLVFESLANKFSKLLRQEYVSSNSLIELIEDTEKYIKLANIFSPWEGKSELSLKAISGLLDYFIDDFYLERKLDLESEIVCDLKNVIDRIILQLDNNEIINDFDNLFLLLKYYLREVSVSFRGEPLEGLQVLGILETRLLDFKNVIITSVNEDKIPKIAHFSSFLTGEMVREYQLPSPKAKTAVFAYHFYRLIQRAENVFLIYDSSEQKLGVNEKSRYLLQILEELPKYNTLIEIHSDIYQSSLSKLEQIVPHPIPKTEFSLARITELLTESGISASALDYYLTCQVKFYFKYILKISDKYDLEAVDSMFIGTMAHDVLSLLYKNYINKKISPIDLESIGENIESCIYQIELKYKNEKGISFEQGRNLLVKNMVKNYVTNAVNSDKYIVDDLSESLIIKSLEDKFDTIKQLQRANGTVDIKIKGFIDRFDMCAGRYRVIDYKTGGVKDKLVLNIDKLRNNYDSYINKDNLLLQLLIYAVLIFDNNKDILQLDAGIYSLKQKDSKTHGARLLMLPQELDRENLLDFEEFLQEIFTELLDINVEFSVAKNEKSCEYCSYRSLCMV
ncbi:PD-(D/E)XK nuclease family protein [Odoribacter sp. OttesenSCG-928-L07]|nr:PD-(D/E)XK nuclease family protein [Odoribacter sp. OttesenSCG-928-L07]